MLLFFDGFDQYTTFPDLVLNGWSWQDNNFYGGAGPTSTVRIGAGQSLQMATPIYGDNGLGYQTAANHYGDSLYFGFALYMNISTDTPFINIHAMGIRGPIQISIHVHYITSSTFILQAYRGTNLLVSGTTIFTVQTWRYVEFKVSVNNTTGIIECMVEGALDFTFTGNTMNNVGLNELGGVSFRSISAGYLIDDFYICDSTGSFNNMYLGEQRSEVMNPHSDYAITWSRNTGAANYLDIIDNGAPDENATYVFSNTLGDRDEYGLTSISGVNTVAGVKLMTRATKDNVNPRAFKHGIKSGGVDQQKTYTLGMGYANFLDVFETSDGVSTAFTESTLNSLLSTIEVAT